MKALSLYQPWAAAIARGAKKIETRAWQTGYRGPIWIHAARTTTGIEQVVRGGFRVRTIWREVLGLGASASLHEALLELPRGVLVAKCELFAVVRADDVEAIREAARQGGETYGPCEHDLGNYGPERFAWLLRGIEPLAEPIPCRGRQALFDVDVEEPAK